MKILFLKTLLFIFILSCFSCQNHVQNENNLSNFYFKIIGNLNTDKNEDASGFIILNKYCFIGNRVYECDYSDTTIKILKEINILTGQSIKTEKRTLKIVKILPKLSKNKFENNEIDSIKLEQYSYSESGDFLFLKNIFTKNNLRFYIEKPWVNKVQIEQQDIVNFENGSILPKDSKTITIDYIPYTKEINSEIFRMINLQLPEITKSDTCKTQFTDDGSYKVTIYQNDIKLEFNVSSDCYKKEFSSLIFQFPSLFFRFSEEYKNTYHEMFFDKTDAEKTDEEKIENKIFTEISKFEEVNSYCHKIDSTFARLKSCETIISNYPSKENPYYIIKIGFKNEYPFVFYAYPKPYKITFFDAQLNKEISIKEWRKRSAE